MSKIIQIKSFNSSGEYIGNITDATFDSFRKTINGGLSDLTFKLARKIDNFNTDLDVSISNRIEIWVIDEDTGNSGIMIYNGYIEQQNITANGSEEYVEIICFGVISKLTDDILKSSAQTKLYSKATDGLTVTEGDQSAAEISDIVKAIIDLFNTNNGVLPIYYNLTGVSTVEDTGNNINYTFNALTYLDSLERCRDGAPQNWYWFLGPDNILDFKTISSSADHTFLLNKHIKRIIASKSSDSIKNVILIFDGDATYKEYKNDASISIYGRRVKQLTDVNIKDETTMDNIGTAFIDENKDPKIRIEIEIVDNNESDDGYDIESINPGDTCKITGVTPDENIFGDNMIITEVSWRLGSAILIIETEKIYGMDRLILDVEKKINNVVITDYGLIPESYS